jgi:dipeptidyl aminopeptidase/acylaminoacyl peptidase
VFNISTWSVKLTLLFSATMLSSVHGLAWTVTDTEGPTLAVRDSIEMTKIGVSNPISGIPAIFSPDAKKFLVVIHRGNLTLNTNDYSLLLFHSAETLHSPRPKVLLTVSSSSNNPGISCVRWLTNNSVLFLAEKVGHPQQVYSLDLQTRRMRQITQHPTDILAFDATSDLSLVAYLAREPVTSLLDANSRKHGLLISDQKLTDLVIGHTPAFAGLFSSPPQLFLKRAGKTTTPVAFDNRETLYPWFGVSVSPDGRFAVVLSNTALYVGPERWREYKPNRTEFNTYLVVDTYTGAARPLIDAPTYSGSVVWSADESAVIGATYLPLNIDDRSERELRKSATWTVEVDVRTGVTRKVAQGNYLTMRIDATNNTVFLKPLTDPTFSVDRSEPQLFAYRKVNREWEKIDPITAMAASSYGFEVQEDQDINEPPRLVELRKNGDKSLLLDPNPLFRHIRFGHVEEISWNGKDGSAITGGLYMPPGYIEGRRYPLVIQTHGWYPHKFEVDGFSTAGYAAQALAGNGFVVAQVPEAKELAPTLEGPQNMAMFEGLVDELDLRGLIDRNRVGLLGHSHTGYSVWYMLAFSKYPIAAAAVIEGSDSGYFEYITELNQSEVIRDIYEGQNGTPPFGEGLQKWLKAAPGFNLDKIHTPVRQLGFGPYTFEYNWESFVGLRRLNKPVELTWLPDAAHQPVKPLERMTAQQGNVDWFRFWLQGYEDADPAKAEQYVRWHELRKMQQANDGKAKATAVN